MSKKQTPKRKQPTMRDVAKQAGVHVTTVSLALRNDRRLPQETRERIRAIADDMGYRVDPMVSALFHSRRANRGMAGRPRLAIVSFDSEGNAWPEWITSNVLEGATERAIPQGFAVDIVNISDIDGDEEQAVKTLREHNVQGLIVMPPINEYELPVSLDWAQFSEVIVGQRYCQPHFHGVAIDFYHAASLAYRQCRDKGYRRIGIVIDEAKDRTLDGVQVAAVLYQSFREGTPLEVPPLILDKGDLDSIRCWLGEHKPDCIIATVSPDLLDEALRLENLEVPDNIGLLTLNTIPERGVSGILLDFHRLGGVAANILMSMINRNERGVPENANTTFLEGLWFEGNTLPSKLRAPRRARRA